MLALAGCGGGDGDALFAEWRAPDGAPEGVVLALHGGAWNGEDPGRVKRFRPYVERFEQAGYATYNVDYRTGPRSLDDVIAAFDRARKRYPDLPIAAYGVSAGGHLALMLATRRELSAVISEAGPTDVRLPAVETPVQARAQLGPDLDYWSPITHADEIAEPVLLVTAMTDLLVPPLQSAIFKVVRPATRTIVLDPGSAFFVHSGVDPQQLAAAHRRELRFLARAAAS